MTPAERGTLCQHVVNAVYTELDAQGLLVGRMPQSLIKRVMCSAVIEALYPLDVPVDVPSWRTKP